MITKDSGMIAKDSGMISIFKSNAEKQSPAKDQENSVTNSDQEQRESQNQICKIDLFTPVNPVKSSNEEEYYVEDSSESLSLDSKSKGSA